MSASEAPKGKRLRRLYADAALALKGVFARTPEEKARAKAALEIAEQLPDPDNPEWTEEDFARATPASELPEEMLNAFPRMRGRPKKG